MRRIRCPARLAAAKRRVLPLFACVVLPTVVQASGTTAGTVVDNVASVEFEVNGSSNSLESNTVSFEVLERIDVVVTPRSGQVTVAAGEAGVALLFTVTNTGNGDDEFSLAIDSALTGDDFNPDPAVPAIYFDSDDSGDFSAGDLAYTPGSNDPQLAADASIDILLVNDMPGSLTDGWLGRSQLTATSTSGTGLPGETLAGMGDGGIDAVVGASGGGDSAFGEYRIADIAIEVRKSVTVADPFGGTEPTEGATLTYTLDVEVLNDGTANAGILRDLIPAFSTYVPGSLMLNGANLSDAIDLDAGELDASGAPAVVVRLGDLSQADGIQTIEFQVTID